jgi:hypothetical protein
MSWWRRPGGKKNSRKPAGQVSLREFLESGNWSTDSKRNTYRNSNDPRFQAATKSHKAALQQLDVLIGVAAGQEHLIDLLVSLGTETDDGLWLP